MGQAAYAQSVSRQLSLSPGAALVPASITNTATPTLDTEELNFLTLINNYRAQNGAGALQISIALQNSSAWMANDMATHNSTSHTDSSGRDAQTRIQAFGYPYFPWGENIAGGNTDAQSVFNAWVGACDQDATGACTYAHRVNMLNPNFAVIGIGRAYNAASQYGWFWTTDFGGVVDAVLTPGPPPPTITYFGASQYTVQSGQPSTLSWIISGASSISIDQGIGNVSNLISTTVAPTTDTTYTLTATNSGGIATAQVIVTTAQGCRMDLITANALLLSFPPAIVCQTINKYFVADITYRSSNGNCYETTVNGTTQKTCTSGMPSLPNGQIPNVFDPTFNWSGAAAQCWYTQGDTAGAPYGVSSQKICGLNSTGVLSSHVVTVLTPVGSGPTPAMSFSPSSITVAPGGSQNLTLTLSSPAPSGGLSVALSSSNTSVATVPGTLTIAGNTSVLTVPITGVNLGSATITAGASGYTSASASVSVATTPPPTNLIINTTSLPNGQVGTPYSQILSASGGQTPYTWSLMSGTLPSPVTLTPSTGLISGTPGASAMNTPLTFQVSDSSSPAKTATVNLTLTVTGGLGIVLPSTLSLNPGDQAAFPINLSAPAPTGGIFIALTTSNSSIASLNTTNVFIAEGQTSSTRTKLSGGSTGTATVTASASGFASASTTVLVGVPAPPPTPPPTPATMSFSPTSLAITGAVTQNLTLNLSSPAPNGGMGVSLISSNTGVATVPATVFMAGNTSSATVPVTGVATGSTTITASATNYSSATAGVTVTVTPPPSNLAVTMTPLANGQVGTPYSQTLAATGGTQPYSWTLTAGTLPATVTLKSNGVVSGTPNTAVTNTPLTFQVTDSSSPVKTASGNFTLTITPATTPTPASIVATGGTPQSAATGAAFPSPLIATVRDSNGNPFSGATVTFIAPASGASGAFASGINTAVSNSQGIATSAAFTANSTAGSYVVTASVAGVSTPASFTLINTSAGPTIVLPSTLALNPGDQTNFPITLSTPAPSGGVFVSLNNTNTSVASLNTTNIFIAEGQTSSTRSRLSASANGTASITASASGYASATTTVQVGAQSTTTMTLAPASVSVVASATQTLTVTLSSPAPAGGTTVTLTSSSTGIATVTPSVTIAANTTSASVTVTGVATGSATITASASGIANATANVTVTPKQSGTISLPASTSVTVGSTASLAVTLSSAAPAGGVTVSLISSDPTKATVPASVTIAAGSISPASPTLVTGVASGSVTITASASGYTSGTGQVQINPSAGGTSSFSPATLTITAGTTGNLTLNLSGPAPSGGITAIISSSNSGVASAPSSVFIAGGTSNATVTIIGVYAGPAAITATTSSFGTATANVTVNPPGTSSFSPTTLSVNASSTGTLTLNLSSAAPAGGLVATVGTSNAAVATLPSTTISIAAGASSASVTVNGIAAGSATITANTPNFGTATATVNVPSPGTSSFSPSTLTVTAGSTGTVTLNLSSPAPAGGVSASLTSSNTTFATLPSSTVSIAAGASSASVTVNGVAAGSATITATTSSYGTATANVTVSAKSGSSSFSPPTLAVNTGSTGTLTLNLSAPAPAGGVNATLTSSSTGIASVPAFINIPAGTSSASVTVTGLAVGSATITATTPSYGTATASVTINPGTSSFSPNTLTINVSATGSLTLNLSAPAPAGGVTASVTSSNSGIASVPGVVNFAAGASSAIVTVTGAASGTAAITATTLNFGTATANITVSNSSTGIILPNNVSVLPGQSTSFPVTLATPAPAGGVFITLSSDSPNATIAPSNILISSGGTSASRAPTLSGINNGLANITASASGFPSATAQVRVGSASTAAMSFSPATLSLNSGATQNLTLSLSSAPASPLTVTLTSGTPGVATVPASVSFAANVTTAAVAVTALSAGSTTITATASGLPNATATVNVAQPSGVTVPSNTTVSVGQSVAFPISLPTAASANGVSVSLASSDTTKVTVTPQVFIPAGAFSPTSQPQVSGIATGSVNIVATASGYNSGSGQVQVTSAGSGNAYFLPATLNLNGAVTQTIQLNLSGLAPAGLVVTLSSSNTSIAVVPTSVNFLAGSTTQNIAVTSLSAGSAIITANVPGFGTATANVIVTTLQGVTVTWYGACWYSGTVNGNTGNFQAIDYNIVAPSAVTLQGSLFFSANCDPSGGIDNMNDFGSVTQPSHSIQGFSNHPDVIPSSAIYWIGPRTADGNCAPGSPCSGCLNYNRSTPNCGSLP